MAVMEHLRGACTCSMQAFSSILETEEARPDRQSDQGGCGPVYLQVYEGDWKADENGSN
jgi:hypothetical protein